MSLRSSSGYFVVCLSVVLMASACSSSKEVSDGPEEEPYLLGAFETLHPEDYPDSPPPEGYPVEHDIPAVLLGDGSSSTTRTREPSHGFRIQVFSSLERRGANEALEKLIGWWRDAYGGAEGSAPAYVVYEQPFYKVRYGDFVSREEAKEVVTRLTTSFPGAFVVPSKIAR
jgi:hypothetical protein